ncbi:ribonuclease III [Lentilactobacillus sp. SPB1-3]|uniref:Ribonuclease III n=1 Tax=Lentilactobacillus terminaliae TaxID=3003483 RepID=A0ACD5DC25_9LACO|nr:ribonuclease III [Lentilactobacillus sp. SPB1-3]MCZ0977180.1 ribonuclease III [Lentilactobacillus sp. SPB1-3]
MITGLNEMLKRDFDITISNKDLLDEAFTQASYVNEHKDQNLKFYERIEFLGDAVLQLVVSEYIFKRYERLPQGRLTRLRAAMVNEKSFSTFARECHFNEYIRLGKGEERANARDRDSLLCDIFESFVGALYLDQGKESVERFCHQVIFPKLDSGMFDEFFDHKTELQEVAQEDGPVDIDYELMEEFGPANDRMFRVKVLIADKEFGIGEGHSKKEAEQKAAQQALKHFDTSNMNLL